MGNNSLVACRGKRKQPRSNENSCCDTSKTSSRQEVSAFYEACRKGKADLVQQLMSSMSLDEINKIEPIGSTALHVACYYDHYEIVKLLLNAGASRSIHNRKYSLTPFDEATERTKKLFSRINGTKNETSTVGIDRYTGLSVNNEWMIETKQAAEWKINLYNWLKIEQTFVEMVTFLQQYYLTDHISQLCQSERDKNMINWFFRQAIGEQDAKYIVKAYTSSTQFYAMVNDHLREFLLRFFRRDYDTRHPNTLEKSVGYLASIFIYHPDLRVFTYTGLTYRGMILKQQDLAVYTVGSRLLNKSFLSTSMDRGVAEVFAGIGDSTHMRRNIDHNLIQYITICTYKIKNQNTALNISVISEIPSEHEVLIMPLCAFEVTSIRKHLGDESLIHIEIELEECNSDSNHDINQIIESIPENQQSRIL